MRLLLFPFLVQQCIVEQLHLCEVLKLAFVSKKSKKNIKSWLHCHKFVVVYNDKGKIIVRKALANGSPGEQTIVKLIDLRRQEVVYNYQFWTLLNQNSVPVRYAEAPPLSASIHTYWPNRIDVDVQMLQFIVELFSKVVLSLKFHTRQIRLIRNITKLVRDLKLTLDEVLILPIREAEEEPHDEYVRLTLDECGDAKGLQIACKASDHFEYVFQSPLNCGMITLDHAQWVTKDQVVNFFLSCDTVQFIKKHFSDQELCEIFKAWTINPTARKLHFKGVRKSRFYKTSLLTNVVGHFPGAFKVKKAKVLVTVDVKIFKFNDERGYVIQAEDGTPALVFKYYNEVVLIKDFECSAIIDELDPDHEDRERVDGGNNGEEAEVGQR